MERILFCNCAYMKNYDLDIINDIPINGGSYVAKQKDAAEKINFHDWDEDKYYAFVETGHRNGKNNTIHIEKIDKGYKRANSIDNVLVVFCAKPSFHKHTVIVGWYNNATVYRNIQTYNGYSYFITADKKDVFFVPEESRNLNVPRARKSGWGFGQSQLWYYDGQEATKKLLQLIKNYMDSNENIDLDDYETENATPKSVNIYVRERNSKARSRCINNSHGICQICNFSAKEVYGEKFENKIQVHHIIPISQRKGEYVIKDKDLIAVCPNCHMILHSKGNKEVFTPEEVKNMLKMRYEKIKS